MNINDLMFGCGGVEEFIVTLVTAVIIIGILIGAIEYEMWSRSRDNK